MDDGIQVSYGLEVAIQNVQDLYKGLPKLCEQAKEGLQKNKESMEKIIR